MGMLVDTVDESAPVPKRLRVELQCDGEHLFRSHMSFMLPDGEHVRDTPRRAGWVFTDDGRTLGPCCVRRRA